MAEVGIGRGLDNVAAFARTCYCCRPLLKKKDDLAGELLASRGKLSVVMRVVLGGQPAATGGERELPSGWF